VRDFKADKIQQQVPTMHTPSLTSPH